MSSSDETYLEAFVESLATLPHEIRRNLELLKDLDGSCSKGTERLLRLYQEYLRAAEEKMMQVEIVVKTNNTHPTAKAAAATASSPDIPTVGVRVLGSGSDDVIIVPTTLELEQYTHDMEKYQEQNIQLLQQEVLQKADEKVAIAGQLYHRIDATVRRLDRDLADMEKLLQSSGDFSAGTAAKPNDLAACQVTPGSEWILAKVLHHDPMAGMYKLADEDVESSKIFHLPESQVVLCGVDKLSKGDVVFAVYPDTTSFYQATVVQAPRKSAQQAAAAAAAAGVGSGGGGGAGGGAASNLFVMVNFVDDSDEYGITHDKAVPLKHIIYPPFGVPLK